MGTALGWTARRLALLFVIAAALALAARLALWSRPALEAPAAATMSFSAVVAGWSLIGALLSAAAWAVWRLGGAARAGAARSPNLGRASLVQWAVALAVTAAIFPVLAGELAAGAVGLAEDTSNALARSLEGGLRCMQGGYDFCLLDAMFGPLWNFYTPDGPQTVRGWQEILPDAALAAAVLLALACGLAWASRQLDETASARFWLAYACVAVAAIYLSLSATLAVGLVWEGSAQRMRADGAATPAGEAAGFDVAALRKRFEDLTEGHRKLLAPDDAAPAPAPTPAPAADVAPPPWLLADWRDLEARRLETARKLADLEARAAAALDMLETRGATEFEIGARRRLGDREKQEHFADIVDWMAREVAWQGSTLAACRRELARLEAQTDTAARRVEDWSPAPARPAEPPDEGGLQPPSSPDAFPGAYPGAPPVIVRPPPEAGLGEGYSPCDADGWESLIAQPPKRQGFGATLGGMSVLFGWLLETENMPLTLVTGLVGFGLLGALVSRFVQARRVAGADDDADGFAQAGEIAAVVFTGFTAALVVFVAAYAGVAVATEGGGDPNPYLVFASCLVGAVYSSNVWTWAQRRFSPEAAGGEAEDADDARTGPEPGAEAPPPRGAPPAPEEEPESPEGSRPRPDA